MSEFCELIDLLEKFRDDRDWSQFHDSKNLALALSIEAAELNELFLWKKDAQCEEVDKQRLKEELADVFAYALMLAARHGLDVSQIVKGQDRPQCPKISRLNNPVEVRQNTKNLNFTLVFSWTILWFYTFFSIGQERFV